jgi:hypothetical protein
MNPAMRCRRGECDDERPTEPRDDGGGGDDGGAPAMMMKPETRQRRGESLPVEGPLALAVRRGRMAELAAADARGAQGQGRAGRFLDLFLHQLPARDPLRRAWADKYRDQGLVVIGVHAPEFAFEKNVDNVKKAVADLKIDYPVAIDNDYKIWRAFNKRILAGALFHRRAGPHSPPSFRRGRLRRSERVIQQLLAEAGKEQRPRDCLGQRAGAEAAADMKDVQSPETYVGYVGPRISPRRRRVARRRHLYERRRRRAQRMGPVTGDWTVGGESAFSTKPMAAASPTASTPAICISCSGRGRTASRCTSA